MTATERIRVGVFGAGGRMGVTVCQAVASDSRLELVAAVDPFHAGLDIGQVAKIESLDIHVSSSADALLRASLSYTAKSDSICAWSIAMASAIGWVDA